MVSPPPDVPFADLYVAWSPRGLHLALIGMDYYTPDLLAYTGPFPREEAFRVDCGIDAGAGPRRFAVHVIPPRTVEAHGAPRMHLDVCRRAGRACVPVPGVQATYFGSDQPRITAEVTLPWSALGVHAPPHDVRLALAATAFHRARWMSSSGAPPEATLADTGSWRRLALAPPS
jgi:hypothetical protein